MSSAAAPAPPPSRPGPRAAWAALDHRQRRVGAAAVLVLISLALPWYSETTVTQRDPGSIVRTGGSLSGLAGMSFIEASLLVVVAGVLALLWGRGTQRRFGLPYPDGTLICAAGAWMGLLVVYRLFAHPHGESSGQEQVVIGLNWGIFVSLLAIGVLFAAGFDLRRHGPRDVVPGEPGPPAPDRYPAVDPDTMVVRPSDQRPTEVVPRPQPDDQPTDVAPPLRSADQPTRAVPPAGDPAEPLWAPTERLPRPERPPVRADGGEPPVHEWPSRMKRPERTPLPRDPDRAADDRRRDAPDERS